jgi:hypothetical protein
MPAKGAPFRVRVSRRCTMSQKPKLSKSNRLEEVLEIGFHPHTAVDLENVARHS